MASVSFPPPCHRTQGLSDCAPCQGLEVSRPLTKGEDAGGGELLNPLSNHRILECGLRRLWVLLLRVQNAENVPRLVVSAYIVGHICVRTAYVYEDFFCMYNDTYRDTDHIKIHRRRHACEDAHVCGNMRGHVHSDLQVAKNVADINNAKYFKDINRYKTHCLLNKYYNHNSIT